MRNIENTNYYRDTGPYMIITIKRVFTRPVLMGWHQSVHCQITRQPNKPDIQIIGLQVRYKENVDAERKERNDDQDWGLGEDLDESEDDDGSEDSEVRCSKACMGHLCVQARGTKGTGRDRSHGESGKACMRAEEMILEAGLNKKCEDEPGDGEGGSGERNAFGW